MAKKINISRRDIEEIRANSGLGETTLNYRGKVINANDYVTLDKYDNRVLSEKESFTKSSPIWDDTPVTEAVVWVNGKVTIHPSEKEVNKKADSKTKNYFINYKKEKASDIVIIQSDSYGNLVTKEQASYNELIKGLKYLNLSKKQYCEIISIATNKMKNLFDAESIDDKYSRLTNEILNMSQEDIKKIADNPGVKKMLEKTSEEYKKEYANIADDES